MLKRTLLISCFGLLLVSQNVQAGEAAQNGLIGGAAGGAILGQVIGRDTKGTLIGTAIGGMLGYLVGNDLDQQRGQSPQGYYPPQRVVHQYEDNYPQVQVYDRPVVYYRPAPVVRQVVIIDRGRDYPPRFKQNRGHDREHWQKSRYRTAYQGYPERGRR
ncbi:MAG: hypothetical protein A2512_02460 [Deltaproteobacteria bacterium RIFOXYD12_FULL_56_24]|nr:MAG: hypothetical protein A2512_02460 [Deltaproteobacteria bacterium RIFOXYD12_FULL_56_24]